MRIPEYPAPDRALDGTEQLPIWENGQRVISINQLFELLVSENPVFKGDPGSPGEGYATRVALAAVTATNLDDAYLAEEGRAGKFVFSAANLSAQVAADPQQGIYIAPSSDTTGASGAWVRNYVEAAKASWFGITGDGVTDWTAEINAAHALAPWIYFPAGTYIVSAIVAVAGGHIVTDGIATKFKQKAGVAAGTRIINVNVSNWRIDDVWVEGNIAADTGQQNHGILVQPTTVDITNVSIGNVYGKNLRGDPVQLAGTNTYSVRGVSIGQITADNVWRNGLSITGNVDDVDVVSVRGLQVGYKTVDIEPDPGAKPATNIRIGSVPQGNCVGLNASDSGGALSGIWIGTVNIDPTLCPNSVPGFTDTTRPVNGLITKSLRGAVIDNLVIANTVGEPIAAFYVAGTDLARSHCEIGYLKMSGGCSGSGSTYMSIAGGTTVFDVGVCEVDVSNNTAVSMLSAAAKGTRFRKIIATTNATQSEALIFFSTGVTVDYVEHISGGGRLFRSNTDCHVNGGNWLTTTDIVASSPGTTLVNMTLAAAAPVNANSASTKLINCTIAGTLWDFKHWESGSLLVSIDGTGIPNVPSLQVGGNKVVGTRGASVANAVNAAAAPTQAEFNNFVTQFNALLARLRTTGGHGLIAD